MGDRPYTPRTLAERWGCSERHIRTLIAKGDLPHFRIGCLIRISADVVEAIECGSGDTQEQDGTTPPKPNMQTASQSPDGARSAPVIVKKRNSSSQTSNIVPLSKTPKWPRSWLDT